ncbi:penicillin-binding protein 1A [Candidatus Acidulodesulfobacterium sp. H_13]|uniref:penicillin-binding protein 1A n=1 Tax=Candidatus Acidulodesulfobacterium sp. H_13 TaxID=3395470 RepID=UPI003AF41B07
MPVSKSANKNGKGGKNRNKPKKRKKTLAKIVLTVISILILAPVAILVILYLLLASSVPNITSLKDYHPRQVNYVYSASGKLVGYLGSVNREVVPSSDIPLQVKEAFLAAEDKNFYNQGPLDYRAIARAFVVNLAAGRIVEGGSTITQQVAKTLLVPYQRTYAWKLREAILAYRIANHLSKDDILDIYLNQIYLGDNAYGVEAASLTYFGIPVGKLNLAQAAMLGGLPQAPSFLDPYVHFKYAKRRQKYVLEQMAKDGFITPARAKIAYNTKIVLYNFFKYYGVAPYYLAYIKQDIINKYGKAVYEEGDFKIYAALSARAQKYADEAVKSGLTKLSHEYGYTGPLQKLNYAEMLKKIDDEKSLVKFLSKGSIYKGFVTGISKNGQAVYVAVGKFRGILPVSNMRWASHFKRYVYFAYRTISSAYQALEPGYEILVKFDGYNSNLAPIFSLEEKDVIEGALVSIDPKNGYVRAMVGGYDFSHTQFNRAIYAKRQTGSAFKPILYAEALTLGYTPSSIINNTPVIYPTGVRGKYYKPRNFSRKFTGPTTLLIGLAHSIDVVAVKLLKKVGVNKVANLANKMGIHHVVRNLTMALGSSSVRLIDLTNAYTAFADSGKECKPVFIIKILTPGGKILYNNKPECKQILSPQVAYILTNMLEKVITMGTGVTVSKIRDITPYVAGKTGSSSQYRDGVFVGYTSSLVTGVWTGRDDFHSMGRFMVGAITAAPIWKSYMSKTLSVYPPEAFAIPKGVVFAVINPYTGLIADSSYKDPMLMPYVAGTEPTSVKRQKKINNPHLFFGLF